MLLTGKDSGGKYNLRIGRVEIFGKLSRVPVTAASGMLGGLDSKSTGVGAEAGALVSRNRPRVIHNPEWFNDIHQVLGLMRYFRGDTSLAIPKGYQELPGNTNNPNSPNSANRADRITINTLDV